MDTESERDLLEDTTLLKERQNTLSFFRPPELLGEMFDQKQCWIVFCHYLNIHIQQCWMLDPTLFDSFARAQQAS